MTTMIKMTVTVMMVVIKTVMIYNHHHHHHHQQQQQHYTISCTLCCFTLHIFVRDTQSNTFFFQATLTDLSTGKKGSVFSAADVYESITSILLLYMNYPNL